MQPQKPKVTIIILLITAFLTGLNFVFPNILIALQRAPATLSSNEWWRLLTPVFVNRGNCLELAFNFLSFIMVGVIAERFLGSRRWLIFYLIGGLVGESAGLAWKPTGAGSSVAVCGLLGALAAWLLLRERAWQARLSGGTLVGGAILLSVLRNLHGPPLLVCACAAGVTFWRDEGRRLRCSFSRKLHGVMNPRARMRYRENERHND